MRVTLLGLVLTAATSLASTAAAAHLAPMTDQELTERAAVIVVGQATSQQVSWVGRELFTFVTVAVSEALKGEATSTVTVAIPGGVDLRRKFPIQVTYAGGPQIGPGEEVVLFLDRGGSDVAGAWVVTGMSRGKLSVATDKAGVKYVSAVPLAPDQLPGAAMQRVRSIRPLSEYRDAIKRYVAGQGR